MERGSDKHGQRLDDEIKTETEALERSGKDPHVDEVRAHDGPEEESLGDHLEGTHSSAPSRPQRDEGETGGASHPKPKDE